MSLDKISPESAGVQGQDHLSLPDSARPWDMGAIAQALTDELATVVHVITTKLEPITDMLAQACSGAAAQLGRLEHAAERQQAYRGLTRKQFYIVTSAAVCAVGAMLTGVAYITVSSINSASERVMQALLGSWQNRAAIAPPEGYKQLEYREHPNELPRTSEEDSGSLRESDFEQMRLDQRSKV